MKRKMLMARVFLWAALSISSASIGEAYPQNYFGQFSPQTAAAEAPTAAQVGKTAIKKVEDKMEELSARVKEAAGRFETAVNTTDKQRLIRLDQVLATIDSAIKECGPEGDMYQNLCKAIQTSEEQQKKWKAISQDPNISPETRESFENLARRFDKSVRNLYDNRALLDQKRRDLEGKAKILSEKKIYVIALIQADEMAEANKALIKAITSINELTDEIDNFAKDLTKEGGETKTVTQ